MIKVILVYDISRITEFFQKNDMSLYEINVIKGLFFASS